MYFIRLEELRKEKSMTQKGVADYLGCQREVYRRYEKGIRTIPIDFLVKLSRFYGVSIDYIVEENDIREPEMHEENAEQNVDQI